MRMQLGWMCLTLMLVLGTGVLAQDAKVEVGDKAPEFQGKDDEGKLWKSSDHVGKKVLVVYFYPADFTGGCTKQACGFRDDFKALTDKGIEVIGVSGDTAETHALFKKFHKLPFTLLADPKGEIAKAFGVPVRRGGSIEREVFGEKRTLTRGVSASRWTFVIGEDKTIVFKNDKVNAAQDSKKILDTIKK